MDESGLPFVLPLGPPPNPLLDEEERKLLGRAPEECLRRATIRGALALDELVAGLPPRIAAALRYIVTGERPAAGEGEAGQVPERSEPSMWREALGDPFPGLAALMDDGLLSEGEAIQAANTVDRALGRYLTGTLYAAP